MSFTDMELEKLNWKHSHEFEFNGQMYDVVNKEIHGKTTVLWCWNDSKETAINKQIDKLLAFALGNNQQSKETQKRLNNYFNSLFYNELQPLKIFINHNNYQYSIYKVVYHLLRLSPPSPPPQIDWFIHN